MQCDETGESLHRLCWMQCDEMGGMQAGRQG